MRSRYKNLALAVIIGFLSIGWTGSLNASFSVFCRWLEWLSTRQPEEPDSGVLVQIAVGHFTLSMLWLSFVIFFWTVFMFLKMTKKDCCPLQKSI